MDDSGSEEMGDNVVMPEGYEADGGGGDILSDDASSGDQGSDTEMEQFDITLAASHSYMGSELQPVSGRCVLEAGWEGKVPVIAHNIAVFPGETIPMLIQEPHDIQILSDAIAKDKLFGLLCPDESGTLVSGYGALCEVFEVAQGDVLTFKARATNRFKFKQMPHKYEHMDLYFRVRSVSIVVLPELELPDALWSSRLLSLDRLRGSTDRTSRLVCISDAACTSWPRWVWSATCARTLRARLECHFGRTLPMDPSSLSYWAARNLPLGPRDKLRLLAVDSATLRLYMEVRTLKKSGVLSCVRCGAGVARQEDVFAMNSDGVHANYTNPGGFVHGVCTVRGAAGARLAGSASAQYSWFPGYAWTIAVCRGCHDHVGWKFTSVRGGLSPRSFWALCGARIAPAASSNTTSSPTPPHD